MFDSAKFSIRHGLRTEPAGSYDIILAIDLAHKYELRIRKL
jgi:hypothetical protein